MDIEGYISIAEIEIELLKESIPLAENDVTIRVLEDAIAKRRKAIKKVREKYKS